MRRWKPKRTRRPIRTTPFPQCCGLDVRHGMLGIVLPWPADAERPRAVTVVNRYDEDWVFEYPRIFWELEHRTDIGPCFICGEPVLALGHRTLGEHYRAAHDSCFAGRVGPDEPRFQDKYEDLKRRPDGSLYR